MTRDSGATVDCITCGRPLDGPESPRRDRLALALAHILDDLQRAHGATDQELALVLADQLGYTLELTALRRDLRRVARRGADERRRR
ncbi:MAG: hypothetical protein ACHQCG_01435 [Solirubrobacterales bacterium]